MWLPTSFDIQLGRFTCLSRKGPLNILQSPPREVYCVIFNEKWGNAPVCDSVSVCGRFLIFSSVDEANDGKPYDNHYKHYPEWIRIRIDMNCRCQFWNFFYWTTVFYVSVTARAVVGHEIASILLEIVLIVALHLSIEKAQKSRWVKRKRLNGSRIFIFHKSVIEKSWFHSVRC